MKRPELHALKPLIEHNSRINEAIKIVIEPFQELDRLNLPHLFHFDIVKHLLCFDSFGLGEPLEDNNEELSIVRLGDFNE